MIQKISIFFMLLFGGMYGISLYAAAQDYVVHITPQEHTKMKCAVIVVGPMNQTMAELAHVLKRDLEFSGQFDIDMQRCEVVNAKAALTTLAQQGISLALFINQSSVNAYEWRLYDTVQAEMIKGKKYHTRGQSVRGWGHNIADVVWQEITGQEGFFSTKIAYCKETLSKKGKPCKHIYMADYDGTHAELVVATPTINIAPRFNHDLEKPVIFYSESTMANIRMMFVNMKGQRKVASNFDGTNMLPSFSSDGTKLVYCASKGYGNCQLYYYEKGVFKQITHNKGNNVSPSLSADSKKLFYCSDYKQGKPQIYCYDMITGANEAITQGPESCFSPNFSSAKQLLAYSKIVKGTMQLFVYDMTTGKHRQLTFDEGHKDESSWSPCGNYLLYSVERKHTGYICMLNMMTNKNHTLTAKTDVCSYPTWSPTYTMYPTLSC